ncbi:hypothetical protein DQ04_10611010, partial [Trypanosoma grayi]|uniref:hypothetical protein n=1 Tax=Trypanosoma grayi TaxID=71804 RepID=UPI0004F3F5B9
MMMRCVLLVCVLCVWCAGGCAAAGGGEAAVGAAQTQHTSNVPGDQVPKKIVFFPGHSKLVEKLKINGSLTKEPPESDNGTSKYKVPGRDITVTIKASDAKNEQLRVIYQGDEKGPFPKEPKIMHLYDPKRIKKPAEENDQKEETTEMLEQKKLEQVKLEQAQLEKEKEEVLSSVPGDMDGKSESTP